MDSDQKYWISFWALVAFTIMVLFAVVFNTVNERQSRRLDAIAAMVEQGYSPIAADCAADPPGSSETAKALICAIEARNGRLPKSQTE